MQAILQFVNISFISANILLLSHCCAKFGRFNKVPNFGSCNVDGVFASLWRVHCLQWHSIDLARNCASMLICSPGLGLQLQGYFVSCLAQLSLQRCCMPQQDLPFGDKSLTFVTRHYIIVFPVSWSTSFGSAIGHWLSKVDSIVQFRQREAPLLLYMCINPACCCCWQPLFHEHANTLNQMTSLVVVVSALCRYFFPTSTSLYLGVNFWPLIECIFTVVRSAKCSTPLFASTITDFGRSAVDACWFLDPDASAAHVWLVTLWAWEPTGIAKVNLRCQAS